MQLPLLILGAVLGSLLTCVLIWTYYGTRPQSLPPGYFSRVARSVVLTGIIAGVVRLGLDYAQTGTWSTDGAWFGSGWLLGGLVAAWFLAGRR